MAASDALQGLQFAAIRGAYSTTHYAYLPGAGVHVGHISVNHLPDEPAELASIWVGDDYQGRGLGSALLEHAIAQHPGPMTLHAHPFGNKAMTTTRSAPSTGGTDSGPGRTAR